MDNTITLESLILEHKERISQLKYKPDTVQIVGDIHITTMIDDEE